jgi:hypothetical protein
MRLSLIAALATLTGIVSAADTLNARPFDPNVSDLDQLAVGEWWKQPTKAISMNVPRDQVIGFVVYAHDRGVLKLTAQFFPLMPDEVLKARLELKRGEQWEQVAETDILYPGWSAHFRIPQWDNSKTVAYRVRHGEKATYEGIIRKDPTDKNNIVVASLSCNSSRTLGPRDDIVNNLIEQDPDVLFFAGDQTYLHYDHTAGWLEFGLQFRAVMKDRPTITIPDDHDVGHGNLWGENGKKSLEKDGSDGGYTHPPAYVKMVERQQTWHLPDPASTTPILQGMMTYYTNLRVGGIDFAILEDRKFKSGPFGKIPQMGPRPDHINDASYDRSAINLPGLELLGKNQLEWLDNWTADWTGAEMKCVLSQTAFCGAVHIHGKFTNRLLADLDCNGWPQKGRDAALTVIRRAWAPHLCGDQHLAVVVKHGITAHSDGPWGFTNPAIVNTIYGRWWSPLEEKAGANPIVGSPLPWTGDYEDGLGNKITMHAYANPPADHKTNEKNRADGYGLIHFKKDTRTMVFECWPRFSKVADGNKAQFPGWPITASYDSNDGRAVVGYLPSLQFSSLNNPVVQVIHDDSKEVLYTIRVQGNTFQPRVYSAGNYTVKYGANKPDGGTLHGLSVGKQNDGRKQMVP